MMTLVSVATYSESRAQKVIPLSLVWEWQSIVGGSVFAVARWLVYHWGGGGNTLIAPPPPTYTHVAFLSEFLISVIKHYYKVGPEIISYYYQLYYLWSDTVARIAAKKHAYVGSGAEYCHNRRAPAARAVIQFRH